MGLLLSVLVACVGVAELLAFYSNLTRNVIADSNQPTSTKTYCDNVKARRSQLPITENATIQTLTVTSEDIELEIPPNVIRSRSSSPRRFLLTQTKPASKSSPLRRFVVANANDLPEGAVSDPKIPSFLVEEQRGRSRDGTPQRQFMLSDHLRSKSPVPLPDQFIVTEPESKEGSPAPQEFRRSASPYPGLVLQVPRNSICNELLDQSVSVLEVDEEGLSESSPTPERRIDTILQSQHDSTEFWTNKILVLQSKQKSRTQSPTCSSPGSPHHGQLSRIKSRSEPNFDEECMNENNNNNESFDAKYLDELDGVKRKKLSRNSLTRRSRKNRYRSTAMNGKNDNKNGSTSSLTTDEASSCKTDNDTAKTLTAAANMLKSNGDGSSDAAGSKNEQRAVEPFWVNRE